MSVGSTRKGFTLVKSNGDAVNIIIGEIVILSCAVDFNYRN